MTSEIILSLLKTFRSPLIKFMGEIKEEIFQVLNDGVGPYLEVYYGKFNKTKTFLHRDSLVKFDDTYFPVSLRHNGPSFKFTSLENFYDFGSKMILIGNAGSGKSMLMKAVFLKAIYQKIKIPIFIELKQFNHFQGTFQDFVINKVLSNHLSHGKSTSHSLLKSGIFLFLLDGYDEIYSNKKSIVTSEIEDFIDCYSLNWCIITTRPDAGIESFPRFHNIYVGPLESNEIDDFILKQCKIIDDLDFGNLLIQKINLPENEPYHHYLKSPLLLSMFIFTFRNHPSIPKSKSMFYWNVFDTLFTKHDSFTKKGGWQHEKLSGLDEKEFKDILKWLSYISFFDGIYKYDSKYLNEKLQLICIELKINSPVTDIIYDLTVNIGILQKDGIDYYFPHKSLQEYFSALLISELSQELKIKIYTKHFDSLSQNSMGGLENFFSLIEELDPIVFRKYYLLPRVEKLLMKLDPDLNDNDLIKKFIEEFDADIIFDTRDNLVVNFCADYSYEYNSNYIYTYLGLKQYFTYDEQLSIFYSLESTQKTILSNETILQNKEFSLSDNFELFKEGIEKTSLVPHIKVLRTKLVQLNNQLDVYLKSNNEITHKLLNI